MRGLAPTVGVGRPRPPIRRAVDRTARGRSGRIQVGLAVLYFLSGYSKLRSIGIDWIWGDTLRQAIQDKASSGETTALGFCVLRHDWMLVLFQVVALLWEVCFPLVFFRRFRYPVLIVGLLFNIGLWTTVKIEFFGVVACFAAFLPLEDWEQACGGGGPVGRVAAPVDPATTCAGCPRCAGDVTATLLGDLEAPGWTPVAGTARRGRRAGEVAAPRPPGVAPCSTTSHVRRATTAGTGGVAASMTTERRRRR